MTTKTHMPFGDKNAMKEMAAGLFAAHMTRNSGVLNNLVGKMPRGTGGAAATIRKQTTQHMPVVRVQDLGKGRGDEVEFHLIQPVNAKPIMGSRNASGRGVGMKITGNRLRVDQARFPVALPDTMSSIRNPYDLRSLGRPVAQSLADRYIDQSNLVHMAGARGFHNNIEWIVPTENDPEFAEIMVNEVRAPSKNRHFIADGGNGIKPFEVTGDEVDLTSADLMKMDTIDGIATTMEQIALPPPPVKFEGDAAADDHPLRVLLVSPAQYSSFSQDPAFRQLQAASLARAQVAKMHPLFLNDAGLWNNTLIVKMPKPIRFYAGDNIQYCASYSELTESTCKAPAALGTTHAIDRAILLGGQAIMEAYASSEHSGIPYFWSEEKTDHGDKHEILIGMIRAASKVQFLIDHGHEKQVTDYGCTAIDTVVKIIGARQ